MARLYALTLVLCLFVLVTLVVCATLMENATSFSGADDGVKMAIQFSLFRGVHNVYQLLPVAAMLGALVTGTTLARRGELMALQAGGMSLFRQAVPFLMVASFCTAMGLWLGEVALPSAEAEVAAIQEKNMKRRKGLDRYYTRKLQWFRLGDWVMYLPVSGRTGTSFREPILYRLANGQVAEVLHGSVLQHGASGWHLQNAERFSPSTAISQKLEKLELTLGVTPEDLLEVAGNPRHMPTAEISHLIARRKASGADTTAHELELHERRAYPMGVFWMCLLALPWSLKPQRRRSMAVNVGVGVVAIGVLLSATHIFRMLALGYSIPAWVGAWGMGMLSLPCVPLSYWLAQD